MTYRHKIKLIPKISVSASYRILIWLVKYYLNRKTLGLRLTHIPHIIRLKTEIV